MCRQCQRGGCCSVFVCKVRGGEEAKKERKVGDDATTQRRTRLCLQSVMQSACENAAVGDTCNRTNKQNTNKHTNTGNRKERGDG